MGLEKLRVFLGKIELKTPFIMASGIFGFGETDINFLNIGKIGAFTTKTLTYYPMKGNLGPRIYETYGGMINSIGLQNPGIHYFIEKVLPNIKKKFDKIFVSITGNDEEEFVKLIKILNEENIDGIELNLSCPNFKKSKKMISQDPDLTFKIIKTIKNETKIPIIAKLSPNVTDISTIAVAAEEAGADMVSLINTVKGLRINLKKMEIIDGGLSGPAIKPIGLKCVYDIYKVIKIPIIGIGGICTAQDAIEYFLVGANAVEIGSGFFNNPAILDEISDGVIKFLTENNFKSIEDMIGILNEKKV